MEDQCSPVQWDWLYQEEEAIEELKHSLLHTAWELETTIQSAQEEIARKEDELVYIKGHLVETIMERDEAQAKCQRIMLEKAFIQQQLHQQPQHLDAATLFGTPRIEEEPRGEESKNRYSPTDSHEYIIASTSSYPISQPPLPFLLAQVTEDLASKKALPEKGKFLQAVMEAGPLLQTLLLIGPLPQWQHPPPQLNSDEIPPVTIPSAPLVLPSAEPSLPGLLLCQYKTTSNL